MTSRAIVAFVFLAAAALTAQEPRDRNRAEKPESYSPLGFYDLRAFEQAYPAAVGHPLVVRATGEQDRAFRGSAFRGGTNVGAIWTSLGPETSIQDANSGSSENISGRVAALAISPTCTTSGRCRAWVATAGGGVWRTDDALNTSDVGWRWMSQGVGTNNIGSLALDPNDATGNTIYVGTGETNSPNNSGAGTGLYRSTNGGDVWTRVSTMILDPAVSPQPIDFTYTRGISAVVVPPGSPQTIYVATTTAMLGMTGVRGGQVQSNGLPQPRPALYKTDNGGASWTMAWLPPQEPIVVPNPNLSLGVVDTMIGVRDVKLDPRDPRDRLRHRVQQRRSIGRRRRSKTATPRSNRCSRSSTAHYFAISRCSTWQSRTGGCGSTSTTALSRWRRSRSIGSTMPTSRRRRWSTTSGIGLVNTAAWEQDVVRRSRQPALDQPPDVLVAVLLRSRRRHAARAAGHRHHRRRRVVVRRRDDSLDRRAARRFNRSATTPRIRANSSHVDVRAVAFHPKNPRIVVRRI